MITRESMTKRGNGFSLVELLTVIAVISVMIGVLGPSISGFTSTYERKGAVSTVMNTIDRARIAALQNGGNVHLIFARPTDSSLGSDALLVVGEPPLGSADSRKRFFTSWIRLPKSVHFLGATGTLATGNLPANITSSMLPPISGSPSFSSMTFNSAGQVESPASQSLVLVMFEGFRSDGEERAAGGTALASKGLSDSGMYDTIRVSRFTGRPSAEVASLETK